MKKGLLAKGRREGVKRGLGKWMRGGDCGERDEGKGTVEKGMRGGDCCQRDEGRG